jgi:glycosyltransferase involved in cell wall biosynthesis
LKWIIELWLKSKRKEYDWLYLYQPGIDGLAAARIAKYFGRRILSEYVDLLSSDGYDSPAWRIIYRLQVVADKKVPYYSNIILTISTVLKNIYKQRNPGIPILIFPSLVDTSRFGKGDPYRYRKELGLGRRMVISFTGSFVRTEGLYILIEAIANIVKRNHDLFLLIAGGSLEPNSDDASQLILQFGLQRYASYLGTLSEEDVIDLQAASDILVMPKLDAPVNHAGLSTKLAEYLASGKPVIASNVGDVGKYLIDGQDALLIPPGKRDALEMAILRLMKDRKLCDLLSVNGRNKAIRHFGIEVNVVNLMETLRSYNWSF